MEEPWQETWESLIFFSWLLYHTLFFYCLLWEQYKHTFSRMAGSSNLANDWPWVITVNLEENEVNFPHTNWNHWPGKSSIMLSQVALNQVALNLSSKDHFLIIVFTIFGSTAVVYNMSLIAHPQCFISFPRLFNPRILSGNILEKDKGILS